jgi:hypothetical protein
MMPGAGIVSQQLLCGIDLGSQAYADMLTELGHQPGGWLDLEVRALLKYIGEHGFAVLSEQETHR